MLAIRDLRVERGGQTLLFGLMPLDQCSELLAFRERMLELLARCRLTFFRAFTAVLLALDGALESMRQRRVTEAEQQRLETVRVVRERNALKKDGSKVAVLNREVALERGSAAFVLAWLG